MDLLQKYSRQVPYLYYISVIIAWFTKTKMHSGIGAYTILLLAIPFVWQLLKPNSKLNFSLGISFVCLSSYLILGYLFTKLSIIHVFHTNNLTILFILANLFMALWMVRNSTKRVF